MKSSKPVYRLVLLLAGTFATSSYAALSPTEILMKATTLTCTFTSQQQTRWGASGPLKEEGTIFYEVTFDAINHQTGQAKVRIKKRYVWQDESDDIPVRMRVFRYSITFFELTNSGALDPVITTILDDYFGETTKFIAVRSAHVYSSFKRALATQETGTCVPG